VTPNAQAWAILERLAPDQRAAATAPPGPVLCIAPAGSGKTTTLVARIAWLLGEGAEPETITAITFNRRAAEELSARLDAVLGPLGIEPGAVRVRTFHALGLEILRSAGREVELADRDAALREIRPASTPAERRQLDDAFSRLKLDLGVTAADVETDPDPGPTGDAFVAYQRHLVASGRLDFDDLVIEAMRTLEADPALLDRWRGVCSHLLVDEVQDVDRSQLELALRLAAPANRIFLVGDDDQSIYGWRLADVRRVLDLDTRLPGLRRHDLVTNYRCPAPVVERAVRLIEGNRERFGKTILARPGASGRLVLAPDGSDDVVRWTRVLESWPADGDAAAGDATAGILARTNRELVPAVVAAVALGRPFRSSDLVLPLESGWLEPLLGEAKGASAGRRVSPLLALAAIRPAVAAQGVDPGRDDGIGPNETLAALLAWAPGHPTIEDLAAAVEATRGRLRELRRDDATLTLATAHATKGLEFDHVAVLMDGARFPSARTLAEAADPERALEEERRLAYVAWTRARSSLTLLYDPGAPSRFLLEAFAADELGLAA
jgi:superfamily I DNA/RNA helicase